MITDPIDEQHLEEIRLRDWKYRPSDLEQMGMHPAVDRHHLLAEVDRLRKILGDSA